MTSLNKENLSPAAFIGVRGNGIISFGSGDPDLPPPEEVYKILPHYKDFEDGPYRRKYTKVAFFK